MPKSKWQKAEENLNQIIKVTGARETPDGVELKINRSTFTIRLGYIERRTFFTHTGTCYQVREDLPGDEKIASVILLLLNNPDIYSKWRKCRNWHA